MKVTSAELETVFGEWDACMPTPAAAAWPKQLHWLLLPRNISFLQLLCIVAGALGPLTALGLPGSAPPITSAHCLVAIQPSAMKFPPF